MPRLPRTLFLCALIVMAWRPAGGAAGEPRTQPHALQSLDDANPWYPHREFPPLRTPRWVGEDGVDAVVVLAIDDMREPAKYEAFLRPILNRLKQIDGRAPVSIMTCRVRPDDPQLQSWLHEGLSIEVHTVDHPCPLLQQGDLAKARSTWERCVDLLAEIPGNRPVAFRMPCCDSLNTVSPRFYSEIFSGTTPAGNTLQIDSSVFNFFTSDDQSLPRELVLDDQGRERFLKYLVRGLKRGEQVHDHFVNFIRDYPYPYVINQCCWQFPCVAPSDWSAQHLHGVNNPQTVADWKAALDLTVHKQGVFNLVFHPHGWITADQIVELIDHAVTKHGRRVKFLTFREAAERLNRSLCGGRTLRELQPDELARLSQQEHRRQFPGPNDAAGLADDVVTRLESAKSPLLPLRRPDGTHNGFFRHGDWLCWQNEDTDQRADLIVRVSVDSLTARSDRPPQKPLPPVPVGAASIDITPDYPIRLTGYGNRRQESQGVAARIHARAMVVGGDWPAGSAESSGSSDIVPLTVLITVDNCGVPGEVVEEVFRRLVQPGGLSLRRERFVVASTHTHSGPWLRGFAPQILTEVPDEHMAHLQKYEPELIARLVDVVQRAIQGRRPGHLKMGRGMAGFAMNRRTLRNGQWTGFGETPDGPTDHQLPVLAACDQQGRLISVLASYACHATTETGEFNQISGDWPGIAADLLEAEHPGAVALIAIGCGADANPSPRGTHEQARQHGRTIAAEVSRMLHAADDDAQSQPADAPSDGLVPVDPRIVCRMDRIDLPLGAIPTRAEWQQRASQDGAASVHARRFLKLLEDGQPIPATIPQYPVQTWCFGDDLAMVFLGGEVVVDYSIRLNDMFDGSRLWVNAYSNDVPCYIASRRLLREGGYEVDSSMVYYARPTRLAPEAEDLICDTVQRLLPHSFYSEKLQAEFPGPKTPEESLACMTTRPDLKIELVAAEPLIADPVAFDWDVQGRMWVVEMGDYPRGSADPSGNAAGQGAAAGGAGAGAGRIRVLQDSDGDGRYDTAQTFLDGIAFPSGICCLDRGVIVTAAPDVFFAEDTDNDGVADRRVTLFTGFAEGNQQHRVNGMRWGLDGWLYLANGDSGGDILASGLTTGRDGAGPTPGAVTDQRPSAGSKGGGSPLSIRGRDLRIRPETGEIQTVSGQTQFGRERDDFGNWFGNNNSNPIWQYVLEDYYLIRNPHAAAVTTRGDVAAVPGAAPVFPTSRTLARFNDFQAANRFTSACSTMIYRDTLLGEHYYGNAFTSEPVHNLVSRLVLTRDGVGFHGKRADDEQNSEFLASRDNWFRPVMIRTGPDGALYVADMYRQVIEHPEWIPPEYQRRMDLRAGSDRGRIYRIVPAKGCCVPQSSATQPVSESTDPRGWFRTPADEISTEVLVARVASPNGWWRDTAQRLLLARRDVTAAPGLLQLAATHDLPAVRVQALCTLAGLVETLQREPSGNSAPQELDPLRLRQALVQALSDAAPEVRRHAVRLLEPSLQDPGFVIPNALIQLVSDPDPAVVFQLACSLGASRQREAAELLAGILWTRPADRWIVAAVISSLHADNVSLALQQWARHSVSAETNPSETASGSGDRAAVFGKLLGQAAAFQQTNAVREPLLAMLQGLSSDNVGDDSILWLAAADVLRSIRRNGALETSVRESPGIQAAWEKAVQKAIETAMNPGAADDVRSAAVQFAIGGGSLTSDDSQRLLQLLSLQTPVAVQQSVIAALTVSGRPDAARQLLLRWKNFGPTLRSAALDTMLQKETWAAELLASIDAGTLSAADIDAVHRERLLTHRDSSVRTQAVGLFAQDLTSTRTAVVDDWRGRLVGHAGDSGRGRAVFEKRCSACHRLQGIGKSVGADLDALRDRSQEALLTAVLDPNRAVESKFFSYTAVTRDGLAISGMLLSETGNGLTLMAADGKEHLLARSDLEDLIASNRSLMPEGLEKDLSVQDLADVISFVQSSGTPWKRFDGNSPQIVRADADGVITLTADRAEIYGPHLVFEPQYGNLGWWNSTEDYAVWAFESSRSGHYTVEFDYACDNSTAGNLIRLSTGNRLLSARVPGTGTWNDYRRWNAGTLDVHRGQGRLTVTAVESPSSSLIDIRAIRLIPPDRPPR